ncbi:MAG: SDR family oxidoreductase [Gammaproteobacteria bacterium]
MLKTLTANALLGLCTLFLAFQSNVALAGGHTAKKVQTEIELNPALRGEQIGTVLVTGANRGIGLEITRNYAERGWTVIATARKPEKADDLNALAADNSKISVERLDITDPAQIDALASKYKDTPIDVLMNNAAMLGEPNDQNFGSYDYALFSRVIDTNVAGPMRVSEAFIDNVKASEQKKIVAITSMQGSIASSRGGSIVFYNTSKTALNMVMHTLAGALKKQDVTVALISPGAVDTDMMNLALDRAGVKFKLMTPQDSAEAVINITDQFTLDITGTFMSHHGKVIPW